MYVPTHFAPPSDAVDELLTHHGAADLVTAGPGGLTASMLPFVHDRDRGTLRGHLARTNDHWRCIDGVAALVIVHGTDGYVSPSWYAAKREHGRVVPTWNYTTVHVHGTVSVHDDVAWVAEVVRRLTELHESGRPEPWSVDDAPRPFVEGMLRAIVGVQVSIERVEAKFKLSQNRPSADIDGVVEGLRADGAQGCAQAVQAHRPR